MTTNDSPPVGIYRPLTPQRVVVGLGKLDTLVDELDQLAVKNALIITSPSVAQQTPLLKQLTSALGCPAETVFQKVTPHSPIPMILEAAEQARANSSDCLISIGGGSSIDTAKAIAFVLSRNIKTLSDFEPHLERAANGQATAPAEIRALPHIAIPTTGSAAEYSGIAGITEPTHKKKYLIATPDIAPQVSILDPTAVAHTPNEFWLSTLIRSVDHAIEAAYSKGSNPHTRTLAEEAARLLWTYLPISKESPKDLKALGSLQVAAWHSGWAALGAGTGLSHGIGYILGGRYDIPHGICSCVTLPATMQWNLPSCGPALASIARAMGVADAQEDEQQAATRAIDSVKQLIADLGLPSRISELGSLTKKDLDEIASLAMELPHRKTNPREVQSKADMLELLHLAW